MQNTKTCLNIANINLACEVVLYRVCFQSIQYNAVSAADLYAAVQHFMTVTICTRQIATVVGDS